MVPAAAFSFTDPPVITMSVVVSSAGSSGGLGRIGAGVESSPADMSGSDAVSLFASTELGAAVGLDIFSDSELSMAFICDRGEAAPSLTCAGITGESVSSVTIVISPSAGLAVFSSVKVNEESLRFSSRPELLWFCWTVAGGCSAAVTSVGLPLAATISGDSGELRTNPSNVDIPTAPAEALSALALVTLG